VVKDAYEIPDSIVTNGLLQGGEGEARWPARPRCRLPSSFSLSPPLLWRRGRRRVAEGSSRSRRGRLLLWGIAAPRGNRTDTGEEPDGGRGGLGGAGDDDGGRGIVGRHKLPQRGRTRGNGGGRGKSAAKFPARTRYIRHDSSSATAL